MKLAQQVEKLRLDNEMLRAERLGLGIRCVDLRHALESQERVNQELRCRVTKLMQQLERPYCERCLVELSGEGKCAWCALNPDAGKALVDAVAKR